MRVTVGVLIQEFSLIKELSLCKLCAMVFGKIYIYKCAVAECIRCATSLRKKS